jgi:hypothetical protein
MADVGHVVLNRVNSGRYGASIQDVALAPKQFSTWNSGSGGNDPKGKYPKDSAAFQRARQIAEQVVAGTIPGPPGKPLDYHASSISPYWASSKAGNGAITRNGHTFYPSVPVPPGEIPNTVGTALSTVPTPGRPPVPATPSIDLAQYRKNVAPSQLGPDTFAALSKPKRYLGDEIGMSPIQGGKQEQPMFDAAYDTRVGAMRPTLQPVQGSQVGASKAPAPVPRLPSAHLAVLRAKEPTLQAALNAKYPAQLPALPTPNIVAPPTTKMVQSVPVPKPAFSYAGQDASGQHPKATHITSYAYAPQTIPDRLPANVGPDIADIHGAGPNDFNPYAAPIPPPLDVVVKGPNHSLPSATQLAQGTGFRLPPTMTTQLSVKPMPPMPIPRPLMGMGGPEMPAPLPAQMSPLMALQRAIPKLRPPTSPAAQKVWMTGFSDSESSGGAYGGSANDKHRGEIVTVNGRNTK